MGTSIIDPTATIDSSRAKSSIYIPDRAGLVEETFFRTGRTLRNTADRATPVVQVGAPVSSALSTAVANATTAAACSGYDTGKGLTSNGVTVAMLFQKPAGASGSGALFGTSAANYLGLYWFSGQVRFMNSQAGTQAVGGEITPPAGDWTFIIGSGLVADYGRINYGLTTGGVPGLSATNINTTIGGPTRTANQSLKVASTPGTAFPWAIAWAAAFNYAMTDAQKLALYTEVRASAIREGFVVN